MNWTAELDAVLRAARSVSTDDLPRFLGELESVKAVAWQRLFASSAPTEQSRDELLDVEEAARRLGVSTKFLYTHSSRYAFTRHIGRHIRFSAKGLDAYIRRNGANVSLTPRRLRPIVPLGDVSQHHPQEENTNENEEGRPTDRHKAGTPRTRNHATPGLSLEGCAASRNR
jgi:excisionase family DNA binding protein